MLRPFFLRSLIVDGLQADGALLKAEDAAVRVSFCRRVRPSQTTTRPGFYGEDGEEFFQSVLQDLEIWRVPGERARPHGLAWNIGKADSSLDAVNDLRATEERFRVSV